MKHKFPHMAQITQMLKDENYWALIT